MKKKSQTSHLKFQMLKKLLKVKKKLLKVKNIFSSLESLFLNLFFNCTKLYLKPIWTKLKSEREWEKISNSKSFQSWTCELA